MKKHTQRLLLASLCTLTSLCHATNWYVSTNGTGNTGSFASPFSLTNGLMNTSIQGGDTVWLRGGLYIPQQTYSGLYGNLGWLLNIGGSAGNYITYRSYSNEWAVIDKQWYMGTKDYVRFLNLEFMDSNKGFNNGAGGTNNGPFNHFPNRGDNNEMINCVVHDVCNFWTGGGLNFNGNIIWNCGVENRDHVTYPAAANVIGNISGWHLQNLVNIGRSGANLVMQSNIMFGAGQTIGNRTGDAHDGLLGGSVGTESIECSFNYIYNHYPPSWPVGSRFYATGMGYVPISFDMGQWAALRVHDNIIHCGQGFRWDSSTYSTAVVVSNLICVDNWNQSVLIKDVGVFSGTFDYNNYYGRGVAPRWRTAYSYNNFAYWQSLGWDAHGSSGSGAPPDSVHVIPNLYEAKRAHVAVYNYSSNANVSVSLTGVLNAGDTYYLVNAQDYNGGAVTSPRGRGFAIQTGTYNGTNISVPMTNLSTAPVLSGTNSPWSLKQPYAQSPEFGVFVVFGDAGANLLPPGPVRVQSAQR